MIYQQKGDKIKAEELARESLRIRILMYGINHDSVGLSCGLLGQILMAQGNLGDVTRGFYERYLAIAIRNQEPYGFNPGG
jgi:hypothetical protein